MRAGSGTPTVKLATARLEFSRDRRVTTALHATAVLALIVLVALIGRQLHTASEASATATSVLRQRNAALRADVARLRVELELERSTREALAREVTQLDAEAGELRSRLEFFNAQSRRREAGR